MTRIGDFDSAKQQMAEIKCEVDQYVYEQTAGVVQSGPFQGMRLLPEVAWEHTRLAPYLLGCYEEELYGELERQVTHLSRKDDPKISVVGCCEGYYAIGMKRRVPKATVYAVDTDRVLQVTDKNATLNEVTLISKAPIDVFIGQTDLIIMDVEGWEIAYLNNEQFPTLANTFIIVELHDFAGFKGTDEFIESSKILLERFRGSHRINLVLEGPRNPNKHAMLCHMTSDYRWAAVNEGRPCMMGWYVMEPRGWHVV